MCEMCRRSLLVGAAGLTAAGGFFSSRLSALAQVGSALSGSRAAADLPARANFVIRNAYVMTMDPQLGDIPNGSVHVRDGAVAAVGADVSAPGAEVIPQCQGTR